MGHTTQRHLLSRKERHKYQEWVKDGELTSSWRNQGESVGMGMVVYAQVCLHMCKVMGKVASEPIYK